MCKMNFHSRVDTARKNPVKKMHSIAGKYFVILDSELISELNLEQDDSWFEQIVAEDGILLRVRKMRVDG